MPLSNFIAQFKDFFSLNLHMNDAKKLDGAPKVVSGIRARLSCKCSGKHHNYI